MNITHCGQPQRFAKRAVVFCRHRLQNLFITDKTGGFAISARDIEPVVKTCRAGNFGDLSAYLTECSGDLAFCFRRVVRPMGRLQFAEFFRPFAQSGGLFGREWRPVPGVGISLVPEIRCVAPFVCQDDDCGDPTARPTKRDRLDVDVRGPLGRSCQLTAPFFVAVLISPDWTPHFVQIWS